MSRYGQDRAEFLLYQCIKPLIFERKNQPDIPKLGVCDHESSAILLPKKSQSQSSSMRIYDRSLEQFRISLLYHMYFYDGRPRSHVDTALIIGIRDRSSEGYFIWGLPFLSYHVVLYGYTTFWTPACGSMCIILYINMNIDLVPQCIYHKSKNYRTGGIESTKNT